MALVLYQDYTNNELVQEPQPHVVTNLEANRVNILDGVQYNESISFIIDELVNNRKYGPSIKLAVTDRGATRRWQMTTAFDGNVRKSTANRSAYDKSFVPLDELYPTRDFYDKIWRKGLRSHVLSNWDLLYPDSPLTSSNTSDKEITFTWQKDNFYSADGPNTQYRNGYPMEPDRADYEAYDVSSNRELMTTYVYAGSTLNGFGENWLPAPTICKNIHFELLDNTNSVVKTYNISPAGFIFSFDSRQESCRVRPRAVNYSGDPVEFDIFWLKIGIRNRN